jgi:hypothetical protein
MTSFMSGAIMMACLMLGVFFLRTWKNTADRFFLLFAVAFGMLSLERVLVQLVGPDRDTRLFGFRLVAFLFILVAIIFKNHGRTRSGRV